MKKLFIYFILFSFLISITACGVLVRAFSSGVEAIGNTFSFGRRGNLNDEETQWAYIAWKYFENNYNSTGLVNNYDYTNITDMWGTADYLSALHAANSLKLISDKQFHDRISALLGFLHKMKLVEGKLPNIFYNTKSGEPVDADNKRTITGWSAPDIGRLLIWLKIFKNHYPLYSEYIDKVILRWNFCNIIDEEGYLYSANKIENKWEYFRDGYLGFEEYSAKGFAAWGFNTEASSKITPFSSASVMGQRIYFDSRDPRGNNSNNIIETLPFVLDGIEFAWEYIPGNFIPDEKITYKEIADIVYNIQQTRFNKNKVHTARSNVRIPYSPYKIVDGIYANGYPWNTITKDGSLQTKFANVAIKAVFGMWALWETDYTKILIDLIKPIHNPKRGWYEGRFEKSGAYNREITCSTNSIVLESLLFKSEGPIYKCNFNETYYDAFRCDEFNPDKKCHPPVFR